MLRGEHPWSTPTYLLWRKRSDAAWVSLPAIGEPLGAVTHMGNGKNAYLTFDLASGRAIELATHGLHVETDGSVSVTTTGWGDAALRVEYNAPELVLLAGRMSYSGDLNDPWTDMFRRDAHAWIASGLKGELNYVVAVELRLGSPASVAAAA
jgi:hypothetical protein